MADPTADTRPPEPNQLLPEDYFCRLTPEQFNPSGALIELDLGCGDGSFLIDMAAHNPERQFVGVERLMGRVRKVCRKAQREGLENVRVLRLETLYTLQWLLPENSVDRIHLLCPDPWPKARHHKRRIMQEPFFKAVVKTLKPGGEFLFKTDDPDYAQWAEEHTAAFKEWTRKSWDQDDFFYPKTDFQRQWEAEGKSMFSLRFVTPA